MAQGQSYLKIRTLANAGVPLSQISQMLQADASAFAEAVQRVATRLDGEIERLETSRKQIAQIAAGDNLAVPPEVISYLDRLREIGVSERMVQGDGDTDDDSLLAEAADILAGLFEQAQTPGEIKPGDVAQDDMAFDLLDAFAVESDPRAERMLDLMRERGWNGWTRQQRLAEPPG